MCGCNKTPKAGNTEYHVRASNGVVTTFSSENEARVYASVNNGVVTVKKV